MPCDKAQTDMDDAASRVLCIVFLVDYQLLGHSRHARGSFCIIWQASVVGCSCIGGAAAAYMAEMQDIWSEVCDVGIIRRYGDGRS